MSEPPREKRRRGRFGPWLLLTLVVLVFAALMGLLALTGRPVDVPRWVVAQVEGRVNHVLDGKASLEVGGAELLVDDHLVPHVRLTDIRVMDRRNVRIANLPDLRVDLSLPALFHGKIQPTDLILSGATLSLHRDVSGGLNLQLGKDLEAPVAVPGAPATIGTILAKVDEVLETPLLAGLRRVQADALSVTLDDQRAGRIWQVSDGRLTLVQDASKVSIELGFGLAGGSGTPAQAVMTFVTQKGSPAARISARVDNVAAADIAAQAPALAFLKLIEAPISGDFRAAVDAGGQLGTLEGALTFGAGAVRPGAAAAPVHFDKGSLGFTYDPAEQKVIFTDATVQSAVLRVRARGQAYLRDFENGLPKTLLGQVTFDQVMVDPAKLFVEPVRFSEGEVDLRLRIDPFDLQIGQLVLSEGDRRIDTKGEFRATPQGLDVSLDTHLNRITHKQLLALWPVGLVPQTREWLDANVLTGLLFNVRAAVRLHPGAEPELALGYDFTDADVRFIKTMPPIQQGKGYATIAGKTYTMVVDSGYVEAPQGGDIDVAGSVFEVPDIDIKPPPAVVHLKTESTITAALSLLNQPPFQFLSKANKPVDIAEGRARLQAEIKLPLADKILLPDVDYEVTGTLSGARSDQIIKGKVITADSLAVKADAKTLVISGQGKVGAVPADMTWTQGLSAQSGGAGQVVGNVELSQAFVDEFHIGLPPGAVSGKGTAQMTIDLPKDGVPQFSGTSDLVGVGLSLPEIGWSKAAGAKGSLQVAGTLGSPPAVNLLQLNAPGISALGKVELNSDGSLNLVRFTRVKVGDWMDGPVDLVGRGGGRSPAVNVRGGAIDLRRATFARTKAQHDSVPISLALDRLTISQGIVLNGLRGSFTTLGGFNGNFTAQVNGTAPISGTVVPSNGGTAVRIRADDAGAVIDAAGLSDKGRGGSFDLTLIPRAEPGEYDGHLDIHDLKVVKAPAMADLLEAISIVGLIQQLNGPGITFSQVQADFRLTPAAIDISKGSAVGASMGISLAGLFDLTTKVFDMQGVISPIYILNGIGSVLTRKGEGLFGFNYTLRGTSDAPEVSVNPLSILTPGMFRDLFRSAPPSLDN